VCAAQVVALISDHGYHLGDHDGFINKHSNFDAATRATFIVRTPALVSLGTAGTISDAPVE
jgi:hypothetical protein